MIIKYHFFPFILTDVMNYMIMTDMKTHVTFKNVLMVEIFVI